MPSKHKAGGCNCCAKCKCDGDPIGKLHVEISNVSMNFAAPDCLGARFGETIDETWYNGVTFVFDFERTVLEENPNEFDTWSIVNTECENQQGFWLCTYELAVPPTPAKVFTWTIGVFLAVLSGQFVVEVTLGCNNADNTEVSRQTVRYTYDGPCPTGPYSETTRTFVFNSNTGAFNFTAFDADLTWV